MAGILRQVAAYCEHHPFIAYHLQEILEVLHELYEMMRQCQEEYTITFHLNHPDYSKVCMHQCARMRCSGKRNAHANAHKMHMRT